MFVCFWSKLTWGKEHGADLTLSGAVLRTLCRWSPRGSAENRVREFIILSICGRRLRAGNYISVAVIK